MFAWGIDFGTTNSGVASFERGHFRTFGADTHRPFPSVVAVHKISGDVRAVGEEARMRREELSADHHVISSVKTLLGDAGTRWPVAGRDWTPEDVATEILKALRQQVAGELAGGQQIFDKAVFSIPVGFSVAKRRALRTAARRAGFEIAHFVTEPTAAVCRHLDDVRRWRHVAVFDWGGGTLDVSVVEIRGSEIRELGVAGLRLGGDEIDHLLAEHIHNEFVRAGRVDVAFDQVDAASRDRLLGLAQNAKHNLSDGATHADVDVLSYASRGRMAARVDASKMVSLLEPQMRRAFETLAAAVRQKARLSFEQLGCLLMVGGSSKLLGLREYLQEQVPCAIVSPLEADGDWSIAKGAARLAEHPGEYVVAQDLGLRVADNSYFPLVNDGDAVEPGRPVADHHFGLVSDDREARFVFVQPAVGLTEGTGDRPIEVIGYLNVPARGFSDEPIRLGCAVDENHVFRVEARSSAIMGAAANRVWEHEHLRFAYRVNGTANQ